jgi:hypothetical protein
MMRETGPEGPAPKTATTMCDQTNPTTGVRVPPEAT